MPRTTFQVTHDLKGLEARLGAYPQETMAAAVRALNRTMTTVRAEAARSMQKELGGLKIGVIKRQLKQQRATRAVPLAVLTFSNKRFRLFGNYASAQTKHGVPIRRGPWRLEDLDGDPIKPADLAHAFIQRPRRGGAINVWIRSSVVGKRYPITAILAPSLSSAFAERQAGQALLRVGRDRFRVVLQQEMTFRLSKRGS